MRMILACLMLASMIFQTEISGQEKFAIIQKPYLQNVEETEVTVIWETNREGTGWIEIAPDDGSHFYSCSRERIYDCALGTHKVDRIHKVTVKGLVPGTKYRYRVFSQEATWNSNNKIEFGDYASTKVYKTAPLVFTTKDPSDREITFAIVNDVHGDSALFHQLLANCDLDKLDFIVANGDMVSSMNRPDEITSGFLSYATDIFASEKPFYMIRGNHETRGRYASLFSEYFHNGNNQPYYTFSYGDTMFIAVDSGEDKPDNDIEYYGMAEYDRFRNEEVVWLKEVAASEEYRNAKTRIVFMHVPPVGKGMWHGQMELKEKFLPVFNEAGIDYMFCGHTHSHRFWKPEEDGNKFPILVNDNECVTIVKIDESGISVKTIGRDGKTR